MISNKHLFIMTSKEKLKKYQLRKRSYSIDDKGYITENKDFVGYFISTKEAETYANRYYLNYNPNLKVSEVFEGLMKFRSDLVDDTKDDYYLSFRKIKKLHKKYINNLEIQELNEIINSFDTFSNRKRVKTLLSSLLQYAYRFKLIEKGISKDLKLIKCENKERMYDNPFTIKELSLLEENNFDDITYDIISFMIHTGIKIYDVFKLKKENISNDLETIVYIPGNTYIKKIIKTDFVVKKILEKNIKENYLFQTKNGKAFEYTVFNRYYFKPFMKHYKFNHTIQDCHATYLKFDGREDIMIDIKPNKATKAYIHYREDRKKKYAVEICVFDGNSYKRKTIASYEFKWEAEAAVEEYNALSYGLDRSKYQLTFKDVYLGLVKHREVTGKSKDANCYLFAFKALDFMHDEIFYNITKNDLQAALYKCNKNGPTIKVIILLLHQMYEYAIGEKIVTSDESLNIDLGHHSDLLKNPNKIQRIPFTASEIKDVLSDKVNLEMAETFKVLLYSGMRINELLTLKRDAVDIRNNVIYITEEFSKTKSSVRPIPIHPEIMSIIRAHYKDTIDSNDYLFTQLNGRKFTYQNFARSYWEPFMKYHKLDSHNPHDTRHTFSTFWKYCDLDEFYGEIILGHSTKNSVKGLYKTPEVGYLFSELCKLRFDIEPTNKIVKIKSVDDAKESNTNDLDEFKKAKEEMNRLGFDSFAEYNEYLEFKKMRG